MSITVNSEPAEHGAGYNQLVFDVTSTQTAQPNFNFVIDVYVGGVRVNRQLYPKQPASSSLKVDVSPVVRNYLSADFLNASSTLLSANTGSRCPYYVQFGEAYNNASGTLIIYPDLTKSNDKFAYNAVFDFEEFGKFEFSKMNIASGFTLQESIPNYKYAGQYKTITYFDPVTKIEGIVSNGSPNVLLTGEYATIMPPTLSPGLGITGTGIPANTTIVNVAYNAGLGSNIIVLSNNGTSNVTTTLTASRRLSHIRVKQYDNAGSLLVTTTEGISQSGTTYVYNVNAEKISGFSLNANTAYYDVEFMNIIGMTETILETYRIDIVPACTKYGTYRLHWLNQYGGWEAYNFTAVNQKSIEVNRTQYRKMLPLGYIDADRLKVNYNTEIIDNVLLNSDWITDAQSEWMQGLFESPLIWLERSATDFIAVQVTETGYQNQTYLNSGRQLHKITCNMQYSYNRYRQSL
jgi:hypothetical protein